MARYYRIRRKPTRFQQPSAEMETGKRMPNLRFRYADQLAGLINTGSSSLQTKLTIGQPNDRYEREADHVADKVVSTPDAQVQKMEGEEDMQAQPLAGQISPLVQKQAEEEEPVQPRLQRQQEEEDEAQPKLQKQPEEEEAQPKLQRMEEEQEDAASAKLQRQAEEEEMQAKSSGRQRPTVSKSFESRLASGKNGGQPLKGATKNYMESRFGNDFSGVRIHTDNHAVQLSKAINAQAFTVGSHIYFNAGKFSPDTASGKHLLAHELTHTIQQKGAATIQRKMGFEFQTANVVSKIKKGGAKKMYERKDIIHEGDADGNSSTPSGKKVRMEIDSGGVIEFVTDAFSTWSALEAQINDAVSVVDRIKDAKAQADDPDNTNYFKSNKAGNVNIEIKRANFRAATQSTEGFLLKDFASFYQEHQTDWYWDSSTGEKVDRGYDISANANNLIDEATAADAPVIHKVNHESDAGLFVDSNQWTKEEAKKWVYKRVEDEQIQDRIHEPGVEERIKKLKKKLYKELKKMVKSKDTAFVYPSEDMLYRDAMFHYLSIEESSSEVKPADTANLKGILMWIVHYILQLERTRDTPYRPEQDNKVHEPKDYLNLMARADFVSMFNALSNMEKRMFVDLVERKEDNPIERETGVNLNDDLYKSGYWAWARIYYPNKNKRKKHRVLLKEGKVVAFRSKIPDSDEHEIIECDTIDPEHCETKYPITRLTLGDWLRSMYLEAYRKVKYKKYKDREPEINAEGKIIMSSKDLMSPMPGFSNYSTGDWEMGTGDEAGFTYAETRNYKHKFSEWNAASMTKKSKYVPYNEWVSFADDRFHTASILRPDSKLIYDGSRMLIGP